MANQHLQISVDDILMKEEWKVREESEAEGEGWHGSQESQKSGPTLVETDWARYR